jgi:hypothetical protein
MSIKENSWFHGVGVELQSLDWTANRYGFYTTVTPTEKDLFNWVHFPIPTPVILEDEKVKASIGHARFATGLDAKIVNFHVYDGETPLIKLDTDYSGATQTVDVKIGDIPISYGVEVSLGVQFKGTGSENYVNLIGAGVTFIL